MPQLLSINNYYYRRGGSEAVFFEHNRLLEEAHWTVVPFSMHDPKNLPTPWSRHFADAAEFENAHSLRDKLSAATKIVYSFEAARRIRALIASARPTIAHAHNIYHHLSPSILRELRREGIPVVLTLHDFKIACPAYAMFTQGAVCERCRGGALHNVITHRCIKGSTLMSALIWLESTVHRTLKLYTRNVTRFVTPSRFLLAKFGEWGMDTSRFVYIPNFIDLDGFEPNASGGDTFVYAGRLAPEKGVATLIRAAARAEVRLRIVGTGSDESRLRQLAAQSGGNVEFSGYLSGAKLREVVASARAVVVPSEWYENAPLSVMEAYALGRPVIGARIGGIPELIREGETGFMFEAANVDSLTEVLSHVQALPQSKLGQMGSAGRERMRSEFSPELYRNRMLSLYQTIEPSI